MFSAFPHQSSYKLNLSESSFTVLPHSHIQDVPPKSETLWVRAAHKTVMVYEVLNNSLNVVGPYFLLCVRLDEYSVFFTVKLSAIWLQMDPLLMLMLMG